MAISEEDHGFREAKLRYAAQTHRGTDLILGGVLLWSVFGVLGLLLPAVPERSLIYLFGAGMLFPLGLLVAAIRGHDLLAKDDPLSLLAGMLGGVQILFIPLMLGAYFLVPEVVPWFLGVLVGAHFLPFSWLYDSPALARCYTRRPLTGISLKLRPVLALKRYPLTSRTQIVEEF